MSVETHKETTKHSPTQEVKTVEASKQTPTQEVKTKTQVETRRPAPLFGSPEAHERIHQAEAIIRRNTLWAVGAGAVVVPIADVIAATAVQVKMIKNLSDLYGVKFSEGAAKKVVSSLLVGMGGVAAGLGAASLIKFIPGVGSVLGLVAFPLAVSAFTHALGRVYLMHLESGGTLLDFDPRAVQAHFKSEYEKARQSVEELSKQTSTTTESTSTKVT